MTIVSRIQLVTKISFLLRGVKQSKIEAENYFFTNQCCGKRGFSFCAPSYLVGSVEPLVRATLKGLCHQGPEPWTIFAWRF